jgi:hypothetical protein
MNDNFNISKKRAELEKAVSENIENHILEDTKLNLLDKGEMNVDIQHGKKVVKKGKMTIEIDHDQDEDDDGDQIKVSSKDKKLQKAVDSDNAKNGDTKPSTNKGKKAMVYMDGKWHHFGDSSLGHNHSDAARKSAKARHAKNLQGDDPRSKAFRVYWKKYWEKGGKVKTVEKGGDDDPCWDTHKKVGTKMKGGKRVNDCVPKNSLKKSFGSSSNDLEKARPRNPNLVLTHIVDKNGIHRIVWKSPEDLKKMHESKKIQEPVSAGHKVTLDGEKHTVHRVKKDGYITVIGEDGRKRDKSIKKLKFNHPTTDEENSGKFHHDPATTEGAPPAAERTASPVGAAAVDAEVGLDYEQFGSPAERMEDWVDMIDNFANDESKNLTIAYGTGGVGKTYNVLQNKKITDGLESGEYVKVTGGTTAAGFFEMLYKNKDKKIILDDFDMVYNDPAMLNLLATVSRSSEHRVITYPGSSSGQGDMPSRFEFTGKIMSISNIDIETAGSERTKQKFGELIQNSNKVNLKMTKKETWDLIDEHILHRNGEVNTGLKFQDAYGSEVVATQADREDMADYLKNNWKETKELSGRTLSKCNAIQQYYKAKGEDWRPKADQLLLQGKDEGIGVRERFQDFNDAVDMVGKGLMKSAVVSAVNANNVEEALKSQGLKRMPTNSKGYHLQEQMSPNYIPRDDETFATDMYHVIQTEITDKSLYEQLWEHNGKVLVFDQSADKVLKSDIGQGLMKGALDTSGSGEMTWLTKGKQGRYPVPAKQEGQEDMEYANQLKTEGFSFELQENGRVDPKTVTHPFDLPDRFEFKGRCIFVTGDTANAPQPIQSRSAIANINVNPDEFITIAGDIAENRAKLGNTFSHIHKDVTEKEYKRAITFLEDNKGKISDVHYSEEGAQGIIGEYRTNTARYTNEKTGKVDYDALHKRMRRRFQKGISSESLGNTLSVDMYKAFSNLISQQR